VHDFSRIAAWPLALRAAVWVGLVVFLFPGARGSLGTGLDPSYAFGLNEVAARGLVHGRDVAYTYGPLGTVLLPTAQNAEATLRFRLALYALFAAALARALRRASPKRGLAFAALLLVAHLTGLRYEYQLLFALALLIAPEVARPNRIPIAAIVAGLLVTLFGLIKVSLGICALVLLGGWLVVLALRRPPYAWRSVGSSLGALCASVAVAIPWVFEAPRWALAWLGFQADLASGFAVVMVIEGSGLEVAADLLGLGVVLALWIYAWRTRSTLASFWAVAFPVLILAFRHTLVRQGGHGSIFPSFLLALLALGVLLAERADEIRASLAGWLAALIVALPAAISFAGPAENSRYELALGVRGVENLGAALLPQRDRMRLAAIERRALGPSQLPEAFVAPIRAAGSTVDVLPLELSLLAANRLLWVPTPTLQLYLAYSPRLDRWNAEHFRSGGGADLLLVENRAIDRRQMLWDTPETWRAILERYELDPRRPRPGWIVLRKRVRPAAFHLARSGDQPFELGQPLEVPRGPGWRFAELHLEPSLRGLLAAALWRVPPLFAETTYEDGAKKTWRLVPATASGGLLLAPATRNSAELSALWGTEGPPSGVVRLRIFGPGLSAYRSEARVVWWSGRLDL
jgi:hypothetical protein